MPVGKGQDSAFTFAYKYGVFHLEEALYTNAYKTLDHLKILIREAKISILKEEIKSISAPYNDNY